MTRDEIEGFLHRVKRLPITELEVYDGKTFVGICYIDGDLVHRNADNENLLDFGNPQVVVTIDPECVEKLTVKGYGDSGAYAGYGGTLQIHYKEEGPGKRRYLPCEDGVWYYKLDHKTGKFHPCHLCEMKHLCKKYLKTKVQHPYTGLPGKHRYLPCQDDKGDGYIDCGKCDIHSFCDYGLATEGEGG